MSEKRRIFFLVNPGSAKAGIDHSPFLEGLLAAGLEVRKEVSGDSGEMRRLIRENMDRADAVVVGGGDGTINLAAGVLMDTGKPLGVLPLGTANDFAAALRIPRDHASAARVIAQSETRAVNVGMAGDRPFLNAAHVGMSVEMVKNLSDEEKRRFGFLSYMLKLARSWDGGKAFEARIDCDGEVHEVEALEVAVGNGVNYGGGLVIASDAAMDKDELCCYAILSQGFMELALKLPAFYRGRLEDKDKILFLRGRRIRVETAETRDVMLDGEVMEKTPVEYSFRQGALRVFVPVKPTAKEMGGRMIRDERMAALDKAALSLHAAGHMYGHFAEDLRGEPMAGRFEELASARREQAEELEGLIRELGGLPGEPDPDKLSFTDFLDKVRSALAEDDKTPLLQRARDEERRLRDDLSEVLAHDLPSEAASRLKGMVDSSLETERWLLEELG